MASNKINNNKGFTVTVKGPDGQLVKRIQLGVDESGHVNVPQHYIKAAAQAVRAFQRFNGNIPSVLEHVQKVLAAHELKAEKQQQKAAKAEKKAERQAENVTEAEPTFKPVPAKFAAQAAKYESELAELRAQGYDMPVWSLRLLNKFDGDVSKVAARLQKMQEQKQRKAAVQENKAARLAAKVTAAAPEVSKEADAEPTFKPVPAKFAAQAAKYESELAELRAQGYDMPVCSIRLLNKFDGDVSKVAARLQKVQEQKQRKAAVQENKAARQAAKAARQAAKVEHQAGNAEAAATPDVSKEVEAEPTFKPVPAKFAAQAAKYESELAELRAQGYDMPVCSIRLLNKFDGDVSKVAARLQKVQEQRKMIRKRA